MIPTLPRRTLRAFFLFDLRVVEWPVWDQQHGLRRDVLWSEPDSDEPSAVRAGRRASGRRSGIGKEDGAQRARTKDGAGGGPAEEESPDSDARTDDVFEWVR